VLRGYLGRVAWLFSGGRFYSCSERGHTRGHPETSTNAICPQPFYPKPRKFTTYVAKLTNPGRIQTLTPVPSTRLTHADAAKLTDLGHNCIICMTDFSEGEDSKMLPCMHVVSRPIKTLDDARFMAFFAEIYSADPRINKPRKSD
jgi:hypothetical protein